MSDFGYGTCYNIQVLNAYIMLIVFYCRYEIEIDKLSPLSYRWDISDDPRLRFGHGGRKWVRFDIIHLKIRVQ